MGEARQYAARALLTRRDQREVVDRLVSGLGVRNTTPVNSDNRLLLPLTAEAPRVHPVLLPLNHPTGPPQNLWLGTMSAPARRRRCPVPSSSPAPADGTRSPPVAAGAVRAWMIAGRSRIRPGRTGCRRGGPRRTARCPGRCRSARLCARPAAPPRLARSPHTARDRCCIAPSRSLGAADLSVPGSTRAAGRPSVAGQANHRTGFVPILQTGGETVDCGSRLASPPPATVLTSLAGMPPGSTPRQRR
jgi:hypothetical protein